MTSNIFRLSLPNLIPIRLYQSLGAPPNEEIDLSDVDLGGGGSVGVGVDVGAGG